MSFIQFFSRLPLLIVLFLVFVILNILDGHSTWKVLYPDKYHREINPLARWVFRKLGVTSGIIIYKTVLILLIGILFWYYAKKETLSLNIILSVANIVFLITVVHNYRVYNKIHPRPSKNDNES
ncbi:MAG: DUF5658 family protein [Candidatus Syntrophosphaera sp.]|nr:DUF5658 family protein [Candidatus Syntrophosphaera sp.]